MKWWLRDRKWWRWLWGGKWYYVVRRDGTWLPNLRYYYWWTHPPTTHIMHLVKMEDYT